MHDCKNYSLFYNYVPFIIKKRISALTLPTGIILNMSDFKGTSRQLAITVFAYYISRYQNLSKDHSCWVVTEESAWQTKKYIFYDDWDIPRVCSSTFTERLNKLNINVFNLSRIEIIGCNFPRYLLQLFSWEHPRRELKLLPQNFLCLCKFCQAVVMRPQWKWKKNPSNW